MKKPYLTLHSSKLKEIIQLSSQAKSEGQILSIYKDVLASVEKSDNDVRLIFDEVPDNLRPLAEALYGLVGSTDDENENAKEDEVL